MKHKFSLIDVYKVVGPLKEHSVGKRVSSVYSLSNKTILIKLSDKSKILIDIGNKMYLTKYDLPNNLKTHQIQILLRQHLINRIVLDILQVNFDRTVEIHFNLNYILRIDLYGSGNMIFYKDNEVLYEYQSEKSTKPVVPKTELHFITDPNELTELFSNETPSKAVYSKFLSNYDYGKDINQMIIKNLTDLSNFQFIKSLNNSIISSTRGYIYYSNYSSQLSLDDMHTVSSIPLELDNYVEHEFDTISLAMDTYFSQMEQCKVVHKQLAQKQHLNKKIKDIKDDQQRRMAELEAEIKLYTLNAESIQEHTVDITRILELVNGALATGMDWKKVETMLELDKARFVELNMVNKLNFVNKTVSITIVNISVDLFLDKTVFQNIEYLYAKQKLASEKLKRTLGAYDKSLKHIQKSINKEQEKIDSYFVDKQIIEKRSVYWFEKFHWFITTDKDLVIAGRDAHQNELLVKRYMTNSDLYVHADANTSPSCILKGKGSYTSRSVAEAGAFTVCLSKAWETKIVCNAYYVYPSQVSITPPSGEFLKTGSFMIRGKKNYLPPTQLVLGFGVIFKMKTTRNEAENEMENEAEQDMITPQVVKTEEASKSEPISNVFAASTLNQVSKEPEVVKTKVDEPVTENKKFKSKKKKQSKLKLMKIKKYEDQMDKLSEKFEIQKPEKKTQELIQPPVKEPEPKDFVPAKSQEEYDELKAVQAKAEMGESNNLNQLFGDIQESDEIEFGVAVCAPYDVMKNYKYKVKLTPGTEKKGKSAKTAMQLFLANKDLKESEKQALRLLSIDDMIRTIPNKCKVSAPNLESIKRKLKSTAKAKKQKNKSIK
eukprot:NODE_43_length_28809_cov_0.237200.p2 type:complete len:830 gc:universal NODE_43_length_28809_cov_0.237200:15161-12672(-)